MGVENAEFLARLTNPQARAVMADYVTQTNVTGDLPLYQPTDHDKARAEGWYRSAVPRHRGRPGERRAGLRTQADAEQSITRRRQCQRDLAGAW